MNQSDYKTFREALRNTAETYLFEMSPQQIAAYWGVLEPYDLEAVLAALKASPRYSPTFFPKAGELLALIEGSTEDRAAVAWRTLLDVIARGGYPSLQIADGALAFAMIEMGGYSQLVDKLRSASQEMERAYQKNFTALYRVGSARGAGPAYVLGEFEARNRQLRSWITIQQGRTVEVFQLPTPVLIVGTERFVEARMLLDLRTGQLTAEARAALATGGEALRPFLPAPAPALLPAAPLLDEERATPEEIAQIQEAVAALAGGKRLRRRLLGPAQIEPTETNQIQ